MIANATLLSIGTPGTSTTGGDRGALTVQATNVRCFVDTPTRGQRVALGDRIAMATATIFLPKAASGVQVSTPQVIGVQVDGSSLMTLEVVFVRDRQKTGGLAHAEIYAKETA